MIGEIPLHRAFSYCRVRLGLPRGFTGKNECGNQGCKLTPMLQMIARLSLPPVARCVPEWLQFKFHTSSVCSSKMSVVTRGKAAVSHAWST
jgi:hypothetical protein